MRFCSSCIRSINATRPLQGNTGNIETGGHRGTQSRSGGIPYYATCDANISQHQKNEEGDCPEFLSRRPSEHCNFNCTKKGRTAAPVCYEPQTQEDTRKVLHSFFYMYSIFLYAKEGN